MRLIRSAVVLCLCLLGGAGARAQSTGFLFGSNWMPMKAQYLTWDSVFNTYHGGNNFPADSAWIVGTNSSHKIIYRSGGAIYRFSSGERMVYLAKPRPTIGTDYANFYFSNRYGGMAFPDTVNPTSWEIIGNISNNNDSIALDGNEYAGSWKYPNPGPLKLAAKLRVFDTTSIETPHRDSSAISIVLKEHYKGTNDSDSVAVVETFNIRWDSIHTKSDTVIFMPDTLSLRHNLHGNPTNFTGGLELEVHSRRYVTTFLTWVCIENLVADSLMAGKDLDPTNTQKIALRDTARKMIHDDSLAVMNEIGTSKFYRHYISDEPARSQFAADGLLNTVGYLNGKAVTEFEGNNDEDVAQFITQAKPSVFWRYVGNAASQVCAYADTGLDFGMTGRVTLDSNSSAFTINTQHVCRNNGFGYFPYDSGAWHHRTARDMALDSSFTDSLGQSWWTRIPLDEGSLDTSYGGHTYYKWQGDKTFDPFDYGRLGTAEYLHQEIQHCASAVNASLLSTAPNHPKEWWADFIVGPFYQTTQKYFPYGSPPVAEQYAAALNCSVAMGCHGILIYQSATSPHLDDPHGDGDWLGFVDDSGHHASDTTHILGDTIPTMFKQNAAFANR